MISKEPQLHKELRETGLFVYRTRFDYILASFPTASFAVKRLLRNAATSIDALIGDIGELSITGDRFKVNELEPIALAQEALSAYGSTGFPAQYTLRRLYLLAEQNPSYSVAVAFGRQEDSIISIFNPESAEVSLLFAGPSLRNSPYNNFFALNKAASAALTNSLVEAAGQFASHPLLSLPLVPRIPQAQSA